MKKEKLIYIGYFWLLIFCYGCSGDSDNASPSHSGQGGSLARFAISGSNLYVIGESSLLNYSITDPAKLQ